jgi:hypothetical protein
VDGGKQELVVCGLFWLNTKTKRLQQLFHVPILNRVVPEAVKKMVS